MPVRFFFEGRCPQRPFHFEGNSRLTTECSKKSSPIPRTKLTRPNHKPYAALLFAAGSLCHSWHKYIGTMAAERITSRTVVVRNTPVTRGVGAIPESNGGSTTAAVAKRIIHPNSTRQSCLPVPVLATTLENDIPVRESLLPHLVVYKK